MRASTLSEPIQDHEKELHWLLIEMELQSICTCTVGTGILELAFSVGLNQRRIGIN